MAGIKDGAKRFWKFLNEDTWQSWLVSLVLAFLIIKFVFFPAMSLVTATPLPLVVIESCSMYHNTDFDNWWEQNEAWYKNRRIDKAEFEEFSFKNGLNKGDIILLWGRGDYNPGDVVVFQAGLRNPIIHRLVSENPLSTKGDNNAGQLAVEQDIDEEQVIGKSVARVPGLGWLKLIFFEGTRTEGERGFCR
ncbi:hypothetical protein CO038_03730 [Candidatus Pacearchaeota archaeon CG_4_9_14_0_2_um_filter_39_13]|nr:hypothetical protein [Candidatus Pacearchaeota archaeon]OIO43525.1 MAG: hypothetical protein AUJ64_02290 [Candidatus Pacearchaeota archaeon CG1_02_39_14]PJC44435.1 MAG: hypothetical protein CO038_03730 [Candidatus Pacearchaeota archaeon CG_4_9_14_0_2_um_filter_39_13]